ncbi:MAG: sigma-70 family RNA polymerase sigma factor [Gammaproteobacteria bacterium]
MSTSTAAPLDQLDRLLAQIALGDRIALRQLYDATSAKLFAFALRILGKHELAEEALQETYVSIWHSAGTYQPHLAAPMTWLATIARNKAHDIHRRARPEEVDAELFEADVMNAVEENAPGPLDALQSSREADALARCMARLGKLHRQAIGMAFYHDMSHSEVAEQLKLPIGTVKTWIRRGMEKLKACLGGLELS